MNKVKNAWHNILTPFFKLHR